MKIRFQTCLFLSLFFFFPSAPAVAQLGPKNGADLAATDLERVKVGQSAPDFTLQSHDRKNISLSDYRGKKSVVLVFYRGHW